MKKQNKMGAECDRSMMHVVPKGLGLFRELVKSIIRPIRTLDSTLALRGRCSETGCTISVEVESDRDMCMTLIQFKCKSIYEYDRLQF